MESLAKKLTGVIEQLMPVLRNFRIEYIGQENVWEFSVSTPDGIVRVLLHSGQDDAEKKVQSLLEDTVLAWRQVPVISSTDVVRNVLPKFGPKENDAVILLNGRNHVVGIRPVKDILDPASKEEVVSAALKQHVRSALLCIRRNDMTIDGDLHDRVENLGKAIKAFGVNLIDVLLVGEHEYYSFADEIKRKQFP